MENGKFKPTEIIDAWIALEELSEGDINLSYKSKLESFENRPDSWYEFFRVEMNAYLEKEKNKKKPEMTGKEGIICYLGIFELNQLISELKNRFHLKEDDFARDEDVRGHKFSLVFALDKNLRVNEKSIFLTKSGFIIKGNDITDSLDREEENIRSLLLPLMEIRKQTVEEKTDKEEIDDNLVEEGKTDYSESENQKKFSKVAEEGFEYNKSGDVNTDSDEITEKEEVVSKDIDIDEFDKILSILVDKFYGIDAMRYKVVKNVDSELNNMHSFYVKDLNKVRKMAENNSMTENLHRYFYGYNGKRNDMQTKDIAEKGRFINRDAIEDILQPIKYPLGRFPSNPEFASSLMQQIAINLSINDIENIMSVNGPPGTGKTTLLKDIFADLVVKQAKYIVDNFDGKRLRERVNFLDNGEELHLAKLPYEISRHNCIVASSNNAALQNIVCDIPKRKEIFAKNIEGSRKNFAELLDEVDYFSSSINKKDDKQEELVLDKGEEFWGLFSIEGGRGSNLSRLLGVIDSVCEELKYYRIKDDVFANFSDKYDELYAKRQEAQNIYESTKDIKRAIADINIEIKNLEEMQKVVFGYNNVEDVKNKIEELSQKLKVLVKEKEKIVASRGIFHILDRIAQNKKYKDYTEKLESISQKIIDISDEKRELDILLDKEEFEVALENLRYEKTRGISIQLSKKYEDLQDMLDKLENMENKYKGIDFSQTYQELHRSVAWFDKEFRAKQSELFIEALRVRKQFLKSNSGYLKRAKNIFEKRSDYIFAPDGQELISQAWNWINFAIPVISSTFASFGRMFGEFGVNSLGNTFVDEAGQALPQASVGAIMRSEKVMVVGDPYQIKPVLSVHSSLIGLLKTKYKSVDEIFLSTEASTQTLTDRTSRYGFTTEEDNWIGLPLWVHRRCKSPMFDISNAISYNNCMVFGESEVKIGKADWYDIKAEDCEDKFVQAQADKLKEAIAEKMKDGTISKSDIYVITPFKNVANRLIEELKDSFVIFEGGKATNIGTVHTFQGKEAKIVYFVLGASQKTKGAGRWAVYEANILNVAATRAKEEFYIIGDRELYESLGCKTIEETTKVLKDFDDK